MNDATDVVSSPPTPLTTSCAGAGTNPARLRKPTNRTLANLARRLRENEFLANILIRGFRRLQQMGISVTPSHFYWPIPDIADLEKRDWPVCNTPLAFDFHFEQELDLLGTMAAEYSSEWRFPERPTSAAEYHYNNGFFETVDAEMAYSFVRQHKPARIIEIGTGFSTRVLTAALQANLLRDGVRGELVTIDPNPERVPENGFSNLVTLVPSRVQDISLDFFQSLQSNDILFIDSSHVVSIGSDVAREYLEILPRLRSGVLIHVHDIFIPSDYPRELVLNNLSFWSEQYLLQAFLSFNSSFKVQWASSAMQMFYPESLEAVFPRWKTSYQDMPKAMRRFVPTIDHQRVWPSSFWITRI